jgi:hypothetical protein
MYIDKAFLSGGLRESLPRSRISQLHEELSMRDGGALLLYGVELELTGLLNKRGSYRAFRRSALIVQF